MRSLAYPHGEPVPRAAAAWALWLSLAIVALWVALSAFVNSAQFGDNFEQFVWAHSYEWGYYKHPPLPTWLLATAIHLFGPSPYWTYALAALCTAGTAYFTYRIAVRLMGEQPAMLAILLWGLQQSFSMRAQVFNHNTVMMLAVSATAWSVMRALDTRQRRWWVAAGVGAGAAMLSKYQSVVPLLGVVVAMFLNRDLTRRDVRLGLVLAVAVAMLVFSPHLLWMVQHDFSTLRYATQDGQPMSWSDKGLNMVSFLAQQVRLLFPALLFAALLWMLPGLSRHSSTAQHADDDEMRWRRTWFVGLIAFPLVITLLTCPAFGMKLKNHWGYQCLQFVSLWMAWRLRPFTQRGATVLVTLALLVQALSMAVLAKPALGHHEGHRQDGQYPARRLAKAVHADWQLVTACPLSIVVGPSFEAGMISAYSKHPPIVLESGDYKRSPWVQPEDVRRHGAVYVSTTPAELPRQAALFNSLVIGGAQEGRVYWAVVPPEACVPESRRRASTQPPDGPGGDSAADVSVAAII